MERYTEDFSTKMGDVRDRHERSKAHAVLEILDHKEVEIVGTIRDSHRDTESSEPPRLVRRTDEVLWHQGRFLTRCDPDDYCHKPETTRYNSPDIAFARWRKAIEQARSEHSRGDCLRLIEWIYLKPFMYRVDGEPMYVVNTFGFNNGTAIFVERFYNSNIVRDHYFHARDFDKAMRCARALAKRRGDKDGVSVHGSIRILRPDAFTANPHKDHPGSDEFTVRSTAIANSGLPPLVSAFALMGAAIQPSAEAES